MGEAVADLRPLVRWFARRWRRYAAGVDRADLEQTVWQAVLEAAARHDPARGTLSTIAAPRVRWRVRELCRGERLRGLHVPSREAGAGVRVGPLAADPPGREAAAEGPDLWGLAARVLTPREHEVIRMRAAGLLLREVGDRLGLTRERVRQVEAGAVARMRTGLDPKD